MNLVSVLCNAPSFRRAGRAWPAESVVDLDDFSRAEQQAIRGEALLRVRVLSDEEMQADGKAPKSTKPRRARARRKAS